MVRARCQRGSALCFYALKVLSRANKTRRVYFSFFKNNNNNWEKKKTTTKIHSRVGQLLPTALDNAVEEARWPLLFSSGAAVLLSVASLQAANY